MPPSLPDAASCPSFTILMGMNDSFYLGAGWHAATTDGRYGHLYRPTGKRGELRWPQNLAGGELAILAASSPPMLGKPVLAQARLNGRIIGEMEFKNDLWQVWRISLSRQLKNDPENNKSSTLEFYVKESFVPHTRLKNGDHREMGLFISAVRWSQIQ